MFCALGGNQHLRVAVHATGFDREGTVTRMPMEVPVGNFLFHVCLDEQDWDSIITKHISSLLLMYINGLGMFQC